MKLFTKLNVIIIALFTSMPMAVGAKPSANDVQCVGQQDCDLKWQRAERWVGQNSVWPIKTTSETVIETQRQRGSGYANLYYRITRETQDGNTVIQFHAGCLPSVFCKPNPEKAREAFVQFLQADK